MSQSSESLLSCSHRQLARMPADDHATEHLLYWDVDWQNVLSDCSPRLLQASTCILGRATGHAARMSDMQVACTQSTAPCCFIDVNRSCKSSSCKNCHGPHSQSVHGTHERLLGKAGSVLSLCRCCTPDPHGLELQRHFESPAGSFLCEACSERP